MKLLSYSFWLIAFNSLVCIDHVNCFCYDLIKQYYQCMNLKMIESQTSGQQTYIPDPKLRNNMLNDSLFQSLGLPDMTFYEAMKFMSRIYKQIYENNKCHDRLCRCARNRKSGGDGNYSQIFATDENMNDVVTIIQSYDLIFESTNLLSFEETLKKKPGFGGGDNLPTLSRFCYDYEFTSIRDDKFKSLDNCFNSNRSTELACEYAKKVDNHKRVAIDRPTDEQLFFCTMIDYATCEEEMQLFKALNTWADSYANHLVLPDKELLNYLTEKTTQASEYSIYDEFYACLHDGDKVFYTSLKTEWGRTTLSSIGQSGFSLFSSSVFEINCLIGGGGEGVGGESTDSHINQLIVYVFDESSQVELDLDANNLGILTNQTLKNKNGENVLEVVVKRSNHHNDEYVEIYNFHSKLLISYTKNTVSILSLRSLNENARGLLIDGAPSQESNRQSSRAKSESACREMCEQLGNAMGKFHTGSSKITNAQKEVKRCMKTC